MTSFLPGIPEIRLIGVLDSGVPKRERIVLQIESHTDIGKYAIVLSLRGALAGHSMPIRDSMYWIGSGTVERGDWFFIFTGSGTPITVPAEGTSGKLFIEFWGRKETVFHDAQIVPVLWRLDGIVVERSEPEVPAVRAIPQTPRQLPNN